MPKETRRAQPALKFIPPHFNPLVLKAAQWSLPLLLRLRLRPWLPAGIARVETNNVEELVKLFQQFQAGKVRFLLAFRHPEVDDPLSMFYLLSRSVPQTANRLGIKLKRPIHTHFLYDRGMTLWAGDWLGKFFSFLGGFPVRRGKRVDKSGLQTARSLFLNGKMPLSVAPEGATNGHGGIVSTLEPGVAQLGFWCVEDLIKANRPETVYIVPVAIKYNYIQPPWEKIDWLLGKLEVDSGLALEANSDYTGLSNEEIYYQRIFRLAEYLISQMEEFYQRFYYQDLSQPVIETSASPNQILKARLYRLLDKALQVSEQYFNLQAKGTFIDRCRRVEEAGWSYIYREDLSNIESLPPFKRGLADWVAEEADLRMQHMRLVESFVAVTGTYIQEKPTVERYAEMALLMFDVITRIKGDNKLPGRPRLGWRQSTVTVGEPISVSDRWSSYQASRDGARLAVANLTQDLHAVLQKMVS